MKISTGIVLLTALLTGSLVGCATSRMTTGANFNEQLVPQIVKNKTTKQELVGLIGQPFNKAILTSNSEKWTYFYTDVTSKAQSFVFSMDVQTTGIKKQLEVLLENDIVTNYTYTEAPLGNQLTTN
ncbi:hypothetical protein [Shewanella sp. KCT]|uniref:hypothetical protein n=1 Tax=Shewanella sp. KCT TaxID=2569535 RepID=UPI001183C61D|nr:hypothetical protein [Shewanella sp. KCT]TVP15377.1 hypothetical protein AYI87_06845 [Shewanella sp. KCT]